MIDWSTRGYVATLNTLLTAELEGIRVEGFTPQQQPDALEREALVEVEFERFEGASAGSLGMLDGELFAALIVTRKCTSTEAEREILDLVLEIAVVLQDLRDQGTIGPAQVLAIEPEPLEEPVASRARAWRISYAQQLRLARSTAPEEPAPYETLYTGRAPNVGAAHRDNYERLVPRS
jgi:hypothetical protein